MSLSHPMGCEGSRRAALVLHSLPHSERAALLARLGDDQRTTVQPLLAELAALGIPGDRHLVASALANMEPISPAARTRTLDQACAAEMTRMLASEPAVLVARLLELQEWPWKDALLRAQVLPRRRAIESAVEQLREAAAAQRPRGGAPFDAALRATITARWLESDASSPGGQTAPARWSRWRQLLRRPDGSGLWRRP